jgi:hypothetical protein
MVTGDPDARAVRLTELPPRTAPSRDPLFGGLPAG